MMTTKAFCFNPQICKEAPVYQIFDDPDYKNLPEFCHDVQHTEMLIGRIKKHNLKIKGANVIKFHRKRECEIGNWDKLNSEGFRFKVVAVLNVPKLHSYTLKNSPEIYNTEYEVRLTLFDVFYQQFIGRTWQSRRIKTNDKSQLSFNQPIYFHTSINDSSIVVVMELVAIQTPKNPLASDKVVTKDVSLGWSLFRPFKSGAQQKDVSEAGHASVRKLDVFQGSPRALLFMKDPIETNPLLKLVQGCQIVCEFNKHAALDEVVHLMPETLVFGSDERVPGMKRTCTMSKQNVKDYYIKAQALEPQITYIDKLSINLETSIEKFEADLCQKANHDRLKKENLTMPDGKKVTVLERRLMIGVHNGFCYLRKPQFVHLEPESVIGRDRTNSFGRGKRKEPASVSLSGDNLVLRSRVQLNEMVEDPHVAVVFQLEYILSVPSPSQSTLQTGSIPNLQSVPLTVMVRWSAWSPYSLNSDQPITIDLHGGMERNPDNLLFFTMESKRESGKTGSIKFRYLTSDEPVTFADTATTLNDSRMTQKTEVENNSQSNFEISTINQEPVGNFPVEITHLEMRGMQNPVHSPPNAPVNQKIPSLTRASYARLYSSGFPNILDRHGKLAHIVDVGIPAVNLEKEALDPLQTNEIVVQFLGFSDPENPPTSLENPGESPMITPSSLFFTFQLYRFASTTTQRVALVRKYDSDGHYSNHTPAILRKVEAGDVLGQGKPGLEVRFYVDPEHMKEGEGGLFLHYLKAHSLHVDVWDGDSLLLMGSLSVPLKYLLRGGKTAVCVNQEMDIMSSEHNESNSTFTGDLATRGSVRPLGVTQSFKGKLHLRLGNIGYPSNSKRSSRLFRKEHLVVADLTGSNFYGGSLSSALHSNNQGIRGKCKAKKMVESNHELSELLLVNASSKMEDSFDKENVLIGKEMENDRKRKISRMNAVREKEQSLDQESKPTTIGQRALLNKQERSLRVRDLRTISTFRERLKRDNIVEMLMSSITTKFVINPTLGVAEFVELQLKNPYSTQQTVTVECDSNELRVITDSKEWRYFKGLANLHTPVEENMFNFDSDTTLPQIFLRAKETVYIPFRYQDYEVSHMMAVQGGFKPSVTTLQPVDRNSHGTITSKIIKSVLRTADGRPLAILQLTVAPQPHVVDQTFRFYNPEQTFLKKCIRLPPFSDQGGDFHVVCSDNEIVCQARSLNHDEPREIFLKAPSGVSPSVRRFYLAIYNDPYLASPVQIWQFYLHSLQRVDVNCVMGQQSSFSVVLRGTQTSRKVQCFTSHPQLLKVKPSSSFLLPPNVVFELNFSTISNQPGSKYMYVNVVDTEFHQLIQSWLVVIKTREPVISKEFDIELPRSGGKGCNKMITYTNPYSHKKSFHLVTNRPDLLQFKESHLQLGAGEKTNIGLRFASGVPVVGKSPVYIFINDDQAKNEETFLITVTYI